MNGVWCGFHAVCYANDALEGSFGILESRDLVCYYFGVNGVGLAFYLYGWCGGL